MPTRTQSNKQQDSQKHNCYFSKKNQEFFIYFHEESDIPSQYMHCGERGISRLLFQFGRNVFFLQLFKLLYLSRPFLR